MTNPRSIDLNADLGEGCPNDLGLLGLVTSTAISCGAHAGDPASIGATLRAAAERGVVVGAHPGYPDREGFGRRPREVSAREVESLIRQQVESLARLAAVEGAWLRFVKPHGALYNQAQVEEEVARGVIAAARALALPLLGQPGNILERLAAKEGHRFVAEGFPDRRYGPDRRLLPRTRPDAILSDPGEVRAQVERLAGEGVETLCIHGDDPRALANAQTVRAALDALGFVPRFWG